MFDSSEYPASLDESQFEAWLEKGRESKLSYAYLLVIWDEREATYLPVYEENRGAIETFERIGNSTAEQVLVAAYDLYSESRVA